MNYPLISEYIEAIKFAEDNFEELSYLRPVLGDDGLPVMTSGNFAVVFKMKDKQSGKFYAVKCFTKEQEGRAEAYREIAKELKDVSSPYLVSIRYFDKELFVDTEQTDETEFPVLLMDWVEGKTLDKYLRENLDNKYALEMLAYRFSQLAQWLIPQPFAHGDLKPDNILVREDGSLVLVDYDGMYVPAMKGQKARELGSPDFRHPSRTENDFDEHIDDFPLMVILLSLKAVSVNPFLLEEYGAKDRLLFSSNDYYNIKECGFLRRQIPSGNKVLDRYAYLFSAVCYDEQLPSLLYNLIPTDRPLPLVPYRISNNCYSLYDKFNQKLLALKHKYIDFVDSSLKTSTSCIVSNEYGSWGMFGYKNAAIVSQPRDVLALHWYKQLLNIGKSRTHIIAKDSFDNYGIIDDHNNILLNFVYQEIKPLEVGEEVYIICKEGKYYGILNKELKVIVPCFLLELEDYSRFKIITYKNEQGSSFAMDLTTLNECKLPDNFNRIDDYKEGILTFEIAEEQYRFFNFEKKCYINSYIYQKVSEDEEIIINKSFVLCRRNNTNILVSIDGTEYPIKFEGSLSQYGETVIGVTPIEEKYIGRYGVECTRTNYEVSVFKKNILSSKFIYKESSVYHEAFDLVSEDVIYVSHYGKWVRTGHYINLKGEHVSRPNSNNMSKDNNAHNYNQSFINLIKEKYLNSKIISNFENLEIDQCCFFEINDLGNIALVTYHWVNGSCDFEDYHAENFRLGYADDNMCYWAKDCMINQI